MMSVPSSYALWAQKKIKVKFVKSKWGMKDPQQQLQQMCS